MKEKRCENSARIFRLSFRRYSFVIIFVCRVFENVKQLSRLHFIISMKKNEYVFLISNYATMNITRLKSPWLGLLISCSDIGLH